MVGIDVWMVHELCTRIFAFVVVEFGKNVINFFPPFMMSFFVIRTRFRMELCALCIGGVYSTARVEGTILPMVRCK